MNTDQIAAEAWKRMVAAHLVEDTPSVEADFKLIFLSAIEKAWDAGYVEGAKSERKWTKRIAEAESRAAHASEQESSFNEPDPLDEKPNP